MHRISLPICFAAALTLLLTAGCGQDTSDANTVLEDFVEAVAAKDTEGVLAETHPAFREELARAIAKDGYPPMPDEWSVNVKVAEDGKSGVIESDLGFLSKLEMKFKDGRWWVAD